MPRRNHAAALALRLIKLHQHPTRDPDRDNHVFESLAIELARSVLALPTAAVALGRKGGEARSEAKSVAARENGKRGGRPRKKPVTPDVDGGSP
jgi:hypothetical protein